MRRLEDRAWWPKLLAKKDDHSLRELAELFGVTPGAINAALKRTGVQRKSAPSGPRVGKRAPSTGVPRGRGARPASEERLRPYFSELGQVPDGRLAQKSGLSVATVARIRRSRGIAPVQRGAADGSGASRIDPFRELLGRVPDVEVAALAGVTRAAVRNYRSRRNILSNAENRRRSEVVASPRSSAKSPYDVNQPSHDPHFTANGDNIVAHALGASLCDLLGRCRHGRGGSGHAGAGALKCTGQRGHPENRHALLKHASPPSATTG